MMISGEDPLDTLNRIGRVISENENLVICVENVIVIGNGLLNSIIMLESEIVIEIEKDYGIENVSRKDMPDMLFAGFGTENRTHEIGIGRVNGGFLDLFSVTDCAVSLHISRHFTFLFLSLPFPRTPDNTNNRKVSCKGKG
jgi:hypothetical protein